MKILESELHKRYDKINNFQFGDHIYEMYCDEDDNCIIGYFENEIKISNNYEREFKIIISDKFNKQIYEKYNLSVIDQLGCFKHFDVIFSIHINGLEFDVVKSMDKIMILRVLSYSKNTFDLQSENLYSIIHTEFIDADFSYDLFFDKIKGMFPHAKI